jgi:gliding motility-associated-like protein
MKRLKYTLITMLLLIAALQAAGASYVIDKVCLGADRHYRITGETGSTYAWQLTNAAGNIVGTPVGSKFTDPVSGQEGSEVDVKWTQAGIFKLVVMQTSSFGCKAQELGEVEVFAQPKAFAGNSFSICNGKQITLTEATASDYSMLLWSTSGDGTFNDPTIKNPVYTPGPNDNLNETVTLTLTAQGKGNSGSCTPAVSSITVTSDFQITPLFTAIPILCLNSTPPLLKGTSNNSISGTWYPAKINTATAGLTSYIFTPDKDQCTNVKVKIEVIVNKFVTPLFDNIIPLCQYTTTPAALPTSSKDIPAITGTWTPAFSTALAGNTIYKFVPDKKDQCFLETTSSVTVNPLIIPTFNSIGILCQNSIPPALPKISTNPTAISGTWSPDKINTANLGTNEFTFTPTPGQCASTKKIMVTVNPVINPIFAPIAICNGADNPLPAKSSPDNITGTWTPAFDNSASATYQFNPDKDQCSNIGTLTVTVNSGGNGIPNFNPIAPICSGDPAITLPTRSLEGIKGTWSPLFNNKATTTYLFTPADNYCATTASMTVKVDVVSSVPATFDPIAAICSGAPNPLPTRSKNNITGTWTPAFNNTATTTATTTYYFANTNDHCSPKIPLKVTVIPVVTPIFDPIAAICSGAPNPLPARSKNNITGTWTPAFNNMVPDTYSFNPTPVPGQCFVSVPLQVPVNPIITPTFAEIAICSGAPGNPLPSTSQEGITGTWSPAFDNTVTATYDFKPTNGQCAEATTLTVTVNPVITPTFAQIDTLCQHSIEIKALPTSSTNTTPVTGTWLPAFSTAIEGKTNYAFTPDAGQCAVNAKMDVVITPQIIPTFAEVDTLCQYSTVLKALPTSSTNAIPITGKWTPAFSTEKAGKTTYTFTPDAGQCATVAKIEVVIASPILPLFTQVDPLCQNSSLPITLPASSVDATPITGIWSPAFSTATAGTTIYTFKPDSGQCATDAKMEVVINGKIKPAFIQEGAICQNSTLPSPLSTSSFNATPIKGIWSPEFSTATAGITNYTFTPDSGQCATTATMGIEIISQTIPQFTQIASTCLNSGILGPLPTFSTNTPPISGKWTPELSTTTVGTTTYTFNPNSGQCAATAEMKITIDPLIIPDFDAIGPLYQNATPPALILTSKNGITGKWNPATINTSTVGTTTYEFIPDAEQCAAVASLDITVRLGAIIAGATQIGSCYKDKLDGSSSIGIISKYEWSVLDAGGELTRALGVTTEFILSPSYAGPLPADFRVRLQVSNDQGDTSSDTISINVASRPVANIYSSGKLEKEGGLVADGSVSTGTGLTYKWSTSVGNILSADNEATALLNGAGLYLLGVTDSYGCKDKKDFVFPFDLHQIIARPDYTRTSWANDTIVNVMANDLSTVKLLPGSVQVINQPARGKASVNADGTITYSPIDRRPGRDEFIYEVCDALSFCAQATVTIDIYDSGIILTEGFSPNGDGINDVLVFEGLEKYKNSSLYIYTRSGQLVYESTNYLNDWDGKTINSTANSQKLVPSGTYYYILKLGGTNRSMKGFIYVGY